MTPKLAGTAALAVNVQGLLYTTRAALPHLLQAAEEGPRRVADVVNISSIAGRVAWNGYGVYSLTKFGVNGFTESLRQVVTRRHVRVGLVEPGGAWPTGGFVAFGDQLPSGRHFRRLVSCVARKSSGPRPSVLA
jgi:NAD(P)-dependent dehydrogenase (short-subunit alcohol dehydrogenase family)